MAKINAVVRLDKIKSVYGGHIFNVKATEDMQNGQVGHLGDLLEGEREVYEIAKPTVDSIKEKGLVLIAHSPINYDESKLSSASEQNYAIESGEVVRAYELHEKDIFSVTKEGIDLIGDAPVAGNYVVAQAGSHKLKEVAAIVGDEAFVGKVVRKDVLGTKTVTGQAGVVVRSLEYVVIEIVKNVR